MVKVALRTEDKKERRAERERQLAHKQLVLPKRHYGVVVSIPLTEVKEAEARQAS